MSVYIYTLARAGITRRKVIFLYFCFLLNLYFVIHLAVFLVNAVVFIAVALVILLLAHCVSDAASIIFNSRRCYSAIISAVLLWS